jgi:hypothetical protein
MVRICVLLLAALLLIAHTGCSADESEWSAGEQLDLIRRDYANYYSAGNLAALTLGLVAAGGLAHAPGDEKIQDWYLESVKSETTDDLARVVKPLGNGRITGPAYLGAFLLGRLTNHTAAGSITEQWAQRTLRALLVGVPPVLALQLAIGASRPNEDNSYWRPFQDDNGVSGHSFMGAVPFVSAAKMTTRSELKGLFYAASTLCGLSRINDNAHYFSQVTLGWWMAYLACDSVDRVEREGHRIELLPVVPSRGAGSILLVVRF